MLLDKHIQPLHEFYGLQKNESEFNIFPNAIYRNYEAGPA